MHNELTVLTQIFGQQGALQITAEGVLRQKQERHNTNEQVSLLYAHTTAFHCHIKMIHTAVEINIRLTMHHKTHTDPKLALLEVSLTHLNVDKDAMVGFV